MRKSAFEAQAGMGSFDRSTWMNHYRYPSKDEVDNVR